MNQKTAGQKAVGSLSAEALMAAFQAQSASLENFIAMARSPDEPSVIKTLLRKTIEISIELTGAELGSLMLIDKAGTVVDSILARGEISPELSSELIESVLKNGLAGWVVRHRKVGLVDDTRTDDRWLTLPEQPYTARSALALPIVSGKMHLGILTLMHSMPCHFTQDIAELMKITGNQIALVLDNANLFDKLVESFKSLEKAQKKIETYSRVLDRELDMCRQIQQGFLPSQPQRLQRFFKGTPAISYWRR